MKAIFFSVFYIYVGNGFAAPINFGKTEFFGNKLRTNEQITHFERTLRS